MAGPVWRFEGERETTCDICFRKSTGAFVEGEVAANQLRPARVVCPACFRSGAALVVRGEAGRQVGAPGYAHR